MVQSLKQCAGCGAQMGARGRVCPRCGRGSLFGELLWIAVLGVLLLGIGVLSGLVPLRHIPGLARPAPAAPERVDTPVKTAPAPRVAPGHRQARKAAKVDSVRAADPVTAYTPCPGRDTERVDVALSESSRGGPHASVTVPCLDRPDSSQHTSAPP
jgi:hypothetical protein